MRKRQKKLLELDKLLENLDEDNLTFVFSFVCIDIDVNPDVYSAKDKRQMFLIANELANKIYIDKSYVEFKENKHEDTFMYEEGWKQLCKLVLSTHFGNKATKAQDDLLNEAYLTIICIYISNCIKLFGYDEDNFSVNVATGSKFQVEVFYDAVLEWSKYPGKWQKWLE